jgi:choline dehydrogenase-like flavoprotein
MTIKLDAKIPAGPIADKWENHKFSVKLVNPNNKRKFKVLVVGTGLAGASAASSLAELGYEVEVFTYHDSPRRAHSIAAQGGINASKNYHNDGDSTFRLFYDTVKGGDFRSREANVYRLAEVSSIRPPPPGFPSPVSMEGSSTIAASAAPRSPAPSTPVARPDSSSSSGPTRV